MNIKLSDLIKIDQPKDYKAHFAISNKAGEGVEPLDEFAESIDLWKKWQEWHPKKNSFNRKFIFSLMRYYPKSPDYWLFGGIWEVLENRNKKKYKVKLCDFGKEYIGRLLLKYTITRATRINLEKPYKELIVSQILNETYSGEEFPGFDSINVNFKKLKSRINKEGWKELKKVDGIYLITDTKTGKKYVGSAFSGKGIWSRWNDYLKSGHGGNLGLKKLIKKKGLKYAEANFKFAILETYRFGTSEKTIEERETYWKDVFMSKNEKYGYNKN